jgi:hypothetical protein
MRDERGEEFSRLLRKYGAADRRLDQDPDALALGRPHLVDELSSSGIDEYLQGIGGDVDGTITSTGLRVPTAPFRVPAIDADDIGVGRYLFQLATQKITTGRRVAVQGIRQLVTIGAAPVGSGGLPYVLEQEVTSPLWRFPDGNVEWFLLALKPRPKDVRLATNAQNFIYRFSDTSGAGALLYEQFVAPAAHMTKTGAPDFYTSITSYVPPPIPSGDPVGGTLGAFRDQRFWWRSNDAWSSMGVEVVGPCTIVLMASVRQTNAAAREKPPTGYVPPASQPEEQFIASLAALSTPAYPIYWRIAGSLVMQDVD